MDKATIKQAQNRFKNELMEKVNDYLLTEPDEDEVICHLYFRKGKEEQSKSICYVKPTDDKTDYTKIRPRNCADLLKFTTCPNCGADILLYDWRNKKAPIMYCPFCGGKTSWPSFFNFMEKEYLNKDCLENDLLSDMQRDKEYPTSNNEDVIKNHLVSCNACDTCMEIFEKCWNEYLCQN